MEPVYIRRCTVAEIECNHNTPALLAEYAAESAIGGLPKPNARMDIYSAIEATGAMVVLGAFLADHLVGFLVMVVTTNPHYGVRLAVTESFFVANEHRGTGAGIKMLRQAEQMAKDFGAVGILVSAPSGGRLADVLPGIGYRETNRAFFRGFE